MFSSFEFIQFSDQNLLFTGNLDTLINSSTGPLLLEAGKSAFSLDAFAAEVARAHQQAIFLYPLVSNAFNTDVIYLYFLVGTPYFSGYEEAVTCLLILFVMKASGQHI